ncbi:hypothetical protein PLESTM_000727200 [Pleodorina starrii]|nr:hypothetical protein PLESTM_000727200 [Pleodorina starrii]
MADGGGPSCPSVCHVCRFDEPWTPSLRLASGDGSQRVVMTGPLIPAGGNAVAASTTTSSQELEVVCVFGGEGGGSGLPGCGWGGGGCGERRSITALGMLQHVQVTHGSRGGQAALAGGGDSRHQVEVSEALGNTERIAAVR